MASVMCIVNGVVKSNVIYLLALTIMFIPANTSAQNICDVAAIQVSRETGVPISILKAISRTETGRNQNGELAPWPWTLNAAGAGFWLRSKPEALNKAKAHIGAGHTNIDIGCFQLNYRWHGQAFHTVSDMLDPVKNARYAAHFLTNLYNETGDWMRAVGAYHSRTDEHSEKYKRRFAEIYADLKTYEGGAPPEVSSPSRSNQFPLLQKSNSRPRLGSLVPLGSASSRRALISQTGEI